MTDELKREYAARYQAAVHAVQSGVRVEIETFSLNAAAADPKHLRVGINCAMVEHSALAKLLMDKGIFTDLDYMRTVAEGMEAERDRYEKRLTEKLGRPVKLA